MTGTQEKERWLPIKGYEGYYEISNLGRVKSIARVLDYNYSWGVKKIKLQERIRKASVGKNGYWFTSLVKNGKHDIRTIHRLIAQAFIPNPENKKHINHVNGIKTDNRLENLEWCTHKENMLHAKNVLKTCLQGGQDCGTSKFKNDQILEIRKYYSENKISFAKLGKKHNVYPETMRKIIKKKTYSQV